MMSANVIDIRYARDILDPLPEIVTVDRDVQFGTDLYTVRSSADVHGRGAWFKITDEAGATILFRHGRDDEALVDAVIIAYRAGIARGRKQMTEAKS
jgi:hypothetical protein